MLVFHKLCRIGLSSKIHKTESVSVMGLTRSMKVLVRVGSEMGKLFCQYLSSSDAVSAL